MTADDLSETVVDLSEITEALVLKQASGLGGLFQGKKYNYLP